MRRWPLSIAALLTLPLAAAHAETAGWRTDGTGLYPKAEPVSNWSGTENIIWKTATPAWSNASPAIVGQRLFVLAEKTTLVCIDRATGDILWSAANDYRDVLDDKAIKQLEDELANEKPELERKLAEIELQIDTLEVTDQRSRRQVGRLQRQSRDLQQALEGGNVFSVPPAHPDNGYTSATPVTDGRHVWAVLGTGMVICYSVEGERQWARLLQKPKHGWGHSASPLLVDGKLIVPILDLFALDPVTGQTQWQTPSQAHWGSPAATRIGATDVIVTTHGQIVRASDGTVLASNLPRMKWNGPYVAGRTVYCIEDQSSVYELPVDDQAPLEPKRLWATTVTGSRHYACPVVHDKLVYTISRESTLSVIEAETGKLVYEQHIGLEAGRGNDVYTALSLAGGLLFAGAISGEFVVFKPGRTYDEVARNDLEPLRSTPVFDGQRMYVRGLDHVYCIGPSRSTALR